MEISAKERQILEAKRDPSSRTGNRPVSRNTRERMEVNPWRVIDRAPPAPKRSIGGTLRVPGYGADPGTFNPLLANDASSLDIVQKTFSAFLGWNFKTGQIAEGLAYGWKSNPDGSVWTACLRKNLRWSDGVPLTADDVLFTFEAIRALGAETPFKERVCVRGKPIACEKIDEVTLRFILPEVYVPFLFLLTLLQIVPKHKLEQHLHDGTLSSAYGVNTPPGEMVASGPFCLKEYVPQQRIVLERNPYFHATDVRGVHLPYLDRIHVSYSPDMDNQFLKFRAGELDVLSHFPGKFYDALKGGMKEGNYRFVETGPMPAIQFFAFNQNPDPKALDPVKHRWFSNRLFRQALAYAVNRDAMIREAHCGHGYLSSQDFHPDSIFYNPNVKPFSYEPEKARALLQKAGFFEKGGKLFDSENHGVAFSLMTSAGNVQRCIEGERFKKDLAGIGIEVDLLPLDYSRMTSKLSQTFDWEVAGSGLLITLANIEPLWVSDFWLSSGLVHLWHPKQKTPGTAWEAEIDKLVWDGLETLDIEKRKQVYQRIEEILYKEEVPLIPTTLPADVYAFRNTLGNADPTPLGGFWHNCPDDMLMSQLYLNFGSENG